MLIFKDIITDLQLCTDAFKVEETDDFYIIHGKNIIDATDIDEALIGGNKSQEEEEEGAEACHSIIANVITSCNLQEVYTLSKATLAKKHQQKYLGLVKKMDAEVYNEKKRNGPTDKHDYASDREKWFKKVVRKLTPEESAAEEERGNVFAKKPAKTVSDVLLFDHFCGKDTFTAKRWFTADDDQFELNGQAMPLVQEGEGEGAHCDLILWKYGVYAESC